MSDATSSRTIRATRAARHHEAIAFRVGNRRRLWPVVAALTVVAALLIPARVSKATSGRGRHWRPFVVLVACAATLPATLLGGSVRAAASGHTYSVTASVPLFSTNGHATALGLDSATNRIYVTECGYLANNVLVINGATNKVIDTIPIDQADPAACPAGIGIDASNDTIFVTTSGDGQLWKINGATNAVTDSVAVGSQPSSAVADSTNHTVYVSNSGAGTVSVVNGATMTVTATLAVGQNPTMVAVDPQTDNAYVEFWNPNAELAAIDGSSTTNKFSLWMLCTPDGFAAVDAQTDRIYVEGSATDPSGNVGPSSIFVLGAATNAYVGSMNSASTPFFAHGVAVDSGTHTVFQVNNAATPTGAADDFIALYAGGKGKIPANPTSNVPMSGTSEYMSLNAVTHTLYVVTTPDGSVFNLTVIARK